MDKLGIIGTPSDWLISCNVDKEKAKSVFNIELEEIKIDELKELYEKFKGHPYPDGKFKDTFNPEEILKAYDLYLALKEIVEKHDLKGFTIRCFDLITMLHTTSCLALSLLNEEGIIASCEGDVPAMITMYVVRKLINQSSFQANPSMIDVDKNEMILAHCTLPLNMCTSYKFKTHFESHSAIGIKGEMELGPINVIRINSNLDTFVILKGEIIENLDLENLCRTQIRVKFIKGSSVLYFLKNPLGNHHIVVYGENEDVFKKYFLSIGLKEVTY
jgi:L-fucose isomerase and related proteins